MAIHVQKKFAGMAEASGFYTAGYFVLAYSFCNCLRDTKQSSESVSESGLSKYCDRADID